MKVHELTTFKRQSKKRVGRGISSGQGKTAGRGTKGQNSRTGGGVRLGFEGGQNPLMQRLPKQRGFKSLKPKAQVVYTDQLNKASKSVVDVQTLVELKLIKQSDKPVKVLKRGEVTKKLTIKLPAISAGAAELIKAAGGSIESEKSNT